MRLPRTLVNLLEDAQARSLSRNLRRIDAEEEAILRMYSQTQAVFGQLSETVYKTEFQLADELNARSVAAGARAYNGLTVYFLNNLLEYAGVVETRRQTPDSVLPQQLEAQHGRLLKEIRRRPGATYRWEDAAADAWNRIDRELHWPFWYGWALRATSF